MEQLVVYYAIVRLKLYAFLISCVCVWRGFSFLCGKSLPLALFKFIMLFNCRVCSLVVVVFHGVDVLSTLIVLCVCVCQPATERSLPCSPCFFCIQ